MNIYSKFIIPFLLFGIALIHPNVSFAHPIDNTDSYFYIGKEVDGAEIKPNQIKVYAYMNWFQAGVLLEINDKKEAQDVYELAGYQDLYDAYIVSKLKVVNNDKECPYTIIDSPILEEQFSLSLGTRSILIFECDDPIGNVKIENDLFNEYFEYESNITEIYNGDRLLNKVTLTKDNKFLQFNYNELSKNPKGDQSFDLSANMSTGQVVGAGEDLGTVNNQTQSGPKKQNILSRWNDYLYLKANSLKDESIFLVSFFVLLLGMLHTFEAGHSKAILASAMVNNKMSFKRGAMYALIFTLTHLGDIVILGFLFLLADQFFDVYSKFTMIETIGAYALLLISIYMILRELGHMIQHKLNIEGHNHGHPHHHGFIDEGKEIPSARGHTLKEQILLGFVAGLAPCLFGWSIFMLVISTGNLWLLFPLILSFGIGIYLALVIIAFVLSHLRDKTVGKIDKFARFAPLVSAILLLGYAVIILA